MLIVRNPRTFDTFDRMFDQLTAGWASAPKQATAPAVRAEWHDGSLLLTVDLPGVPREAVKVELIERALTVAVEHAADGDQFRWSRSLQLGGSLDVDAISARYADGRLTVIIPPAAKPEPRVVAIEGGEQVESADAVAIEATSAD